MEGQNLYDYLMSFGQNGQQQAIQNGTMSPAVPNPTMAPSGWLSNLLNLGGGLGSLGGSEGSTGLLGLGQLGLGAVKGISGIIGANRAYGLAQDQFKHMKNITNTNLTNQIQSYNTALADRANTRAVMEGRDQASADRYIEENKLRR